MSIAHALASMGTASLRGASTEVWGMNTSENQTEVLERVQKNGLKSWDIDSLGVL